MKEEYLMRIRKSEEIFWRFINIIRKEDYHHILELGKSMGWNLHTS